VKYDPKASSGRRAWALAQFVLMVLATLALLLWGGGLSWAVRAGAVGLVYLTLINVAGLLENRRWVVPLEVTRWAVTAAGVGLFLAGRL
jgi:hypothetical protein